MLVNQVICLIGASSGIGAKIAEGLFSQGASVCIGARRLNKLEEVAQGCKDKFPDSEGKILPVACDVTDKDAVQKLVDTACEHYGVASVDAMICCSGVMYFTMMKNVKLDQWHQTIDVNCKGPVNCMGAVIPKMTEAKKGKIITISSDAGVRDFQTLAVYCGSKRFVETVTEVTRRELVGTGVTLHTVCPGDVAGTELIMKNSDTDAADKYGVAIGKPVGEGFSRNQLLDPKDVADAVLTILNAPPHVAINSILVEARDQE
eukprot:CAMPEP_0116100504 /NCGR_PEP_ID=MMETSP0327-20121206/12324_1 /TAXON_ID=44447 /ORGANISM="Pseudo-nitzschia delicatissima, Strain B596" /LENGTH=260 /DNA_ID=CAMNT_0003592427 /DNA_START=26 /DNA_END=808 /DNA_ORIENTATION=+